RDAGAVRSRDLQDNRQSQSRAVGSNALPTPEPIKDARPVSDRYARPTVQNTKGTLLTDIDNHFRRRRRMRERILDEIAQRIPNRVSVTDDDDWMIGAGQRDRPAGGQRQMRH